MAVKYTNKYRGNFSQSVLDDIRYGKFIREFYDELPSTIEKAKEENSLLVVFKKAKVHEKILGSFLLVLFWPLSVRNKIKENIIYDDLNEFFMNLNSSLIVSVEDIYVNDYKSKNEKIKLQKNKIKEINTKIKILNNIKKNYDYANVPECSPFYINSYGIDKSTGTKLTNYEFDYILDFIYDCLIENKNKLLNQKIIIKKEKNNDIQNKEGKYYTESVSIENNTVNDVTHTELDEKKSELLKYSFNYENEEIEEKPQEIIDIIQLRKIGLDIKELVNNNVKIPKVKLKKLILKYQKLRALYIQKYPRFYKKVFISYEITQFDDLIKEIKSKKSFKLIH